MEKRPGSQQLKILKKIIQGKRVLDVGDKNSPFLATKLARYAKTWTVVGRPPPSLMIKPLPDHVMIVTEPFETWTNCPPPSEFDVILLPFPSPSMSYDAQCLKWMAAEQVVIFFGHPQDDDAYGSPSFWQLARNLVVQQEEKALGSRMIVFRKSDPYIFKHPYPQKGDRYRLVPSFRWPGKQRSQRPPIVEMIKDWGRNSGPAKIIGSEDVLWLHTYDLGAQIV